MGLYWRRRNSFTTSFIAILATIYITVLVVYFLPIPESDLSNDVFVRARYSIRTRSENNSVNEDEILRSGIRDFESRYVALPEISESKENYDFLNTRDKETLRTQQFQKYSFNELESAKIGTQRRIPDNRPQKCFKLQYPVILPTASVIIIFHNEAWSTLLRTIHSVLTRAPLAFLKEILLVDDCSDTKEEFKHLGSKLDKYLQSLAKVHLLRSPKREGIVAARLRGASLAKGEVLVFLDSHCEANNGWLEPLLARIAEDKRHVVTPDIEVIDLQSFEYAGRRDPSIGVFNWEMLFKWRKMNAFEKVRENEGLPLRSPTMAGGLFAISKNFFYELGSYDSKMSYWGGENLELSFRIWMCGGTIEILPCSKVGHVFRDTMPYKTAQGTAEMNIKRLVDVWLDEYKSFVYSTKSQFFGAMNAGDISDRLELRKRLQCKSFSWYLHNVIPELHIPDLNPLGRGEVINAFSGMCIDTMGNNKVAGKLGLYVCHGMGGNQLFVYTKDMQLWHNGYCMGIKEPVQAGNEVLFYKCGTESAPQKWEHSREFIQNCRRLYLSSQLNRLGHDCENPLGKYGTCFPSMLQLRVWRLKADISLSYHYCTLGIFLFFHRARLSLFNVTKSQITCQKPNWIFTYWRCSAN